MPILFEFFFVLRPWDYSSGCIFILAEVSFRVGYGAPQVRSLIQFWVNLYRRTPSYIDDIRTAVRGTFFMARTSGYHEDPAKLLQRRR